MTDKRARKTAEKTTDDATLGEWLATSVVEAADTGELPVLEWRLKPVFARPTPAQYLKELWGRRRFIWADARARAYRSTRGTFLGWVWLILSPFLNSMIFYIVFGLLLQTSRGIPNFLGYLVIGFNFFKVYRAALTKAGGIMRGSRNLIRAYVFPKGSLVISWVLRSFLDFLPVMAATLLFLIVVPPHVIPTWRWLLIIPTVLVSYVFVLGLAFFTSALTSVLPDLKFVWPLIGRFWFYTSGIFFSVDRFAGLPAVMAVMEANPGYVYLSISRDLLIYQTVPPLGTWLYFCSWAVLMLALGFTIFWMFEDKHGENL